MEEKRFEIIMLRLNKLEEFLANLTDSVDDLSEEISEIKKKLL